MCDAYWGGVCWHLTMSEAPSGGEGREDGKVISRRRLARLVKRGHIVLLAKVMASSSLLLGPLGAGDAQLVI